MKTPAANPPAFPALFVPHGAPTFALRPGAAGAALEECARRLPRPRAIVIVSPHWETTIPVVGVAPRLDTIHDFHGFPQELYALRYPASGGREAAQEVVAAITAAGLPVATDAQRGLDHGAWVPLRLMFPDADVPVIPVSVQTHAGPAQAYRLGQALAPLAAAGFLVIGSGNITHNLRDYGLARSGHAAPEYVHAFPEWIASRLAAHDLAALLDYRKQAPDAARAHPSEEHLLPLFVALGAGGGEQAGARRFHAGIDDYVLAMDAWIFEKEAA
ncbi:MAG: Extradiol ring-cleavage dioxygenase, class enzyme subunit [Paucimonas sp.]|nr:Extradiol ring-cleavage dioxygenase, class enzyme subunit [Paucimonas sp.]